MRNVWKRPLSQMWTAKVQMSVRIRAVWSGHSLLVNIYYNVNWFCKRATKALISLRLCAGWSGPALSANCIGAIFVRRAANDFVWRKGVSRQRIAICWKCCIQNLGLGLHCLLRSVCPNRYFIVGCLYCVMIYLILIREMNSKKENPD